MSICCRFDHILKAVRSLKSYMDSSADTKNTAQLIALAHEEIHALEKIEKGIKSINTPINESKTASSIIEEFNIKYQKIEAEMKKAKAVMTTYKDIFAEAKSLTAEIESLEKTFSAMNLLYRQILANKRLLKKGV